MIGKRILSILYELSATMLAFHAPDMVCISSSRTSRVIACGPLSYGMPLVHAGRGLAVMPQAFYASGVFIRLTGRRRMYMTSLAAINRLHGKDGLDPDTCQPLQKKKNMLFSSQAYYIPKVYFTDCRSLSCRCVDKKGVHRTSVDFGTELECGLKTLL